MAQRPGFIYTETEVPEYSLPDVLGGVTSQEQWRSKREETLRVFSEQIYGVCPVADTGNLTFELRNEEEDFLEGAAMRREVRVWFDGKADGRPWMDLMIVVPSGLKQSVPAFLGLNFQGNHSLHPSETITLSPSWMRPKKDGVVNNRATEANRGAAVERWPLEKIVERGYGLVTIYYGDIDPDFDDGFQNGIHGHFEKAEERTPSSWGSIAGWSWALSRALDCLEKSELVDAEKVVVFGHSRLGKTALWAGATDERFAGVISNNSGCGGAALSRRTFGETVERINTSFPHWFAENFHKYNGREEALPVDQHQLIALIAPRPVYVASAVEDEWADPKGEFLSAKHASVVYQLYGKQGIAISELPPLNQPVGDTVRYHIREGKHDVTDYDWEQYLKMMDELIR